MEKNERGRGYQGRREGRPAARSSYSQKKEAQKLPVDHWVPTYLKEISTGPVPDDWALASRYHLKWIGRDVRNILVHKWQALHADTEYRLVDQAAVWCSALVDNRPMCILLTMADDVKYEFHPGTVKENKTPF